jgi:beta-lactamase regulating signal transducer with metallopeptidase domain
MATTVRDLAVWLADVHLLSGLLLLAALGAIAVLGQPVRRMAVEKATLAGLGALALLCALPGWSVVHLLGAQPQAEIAAPIVVSESSVGAPSRPPIAPTGEMPAFETLPPQETVAKAAAVEPARVAWTWPGLAVSAQAVGSLAVIAWLGAGAMSASRLRRRARPASAAARELLESLVGRARAPELLTSDAIAAPVALGVLRPTILLPTSLAKAEPREMAAILAHEWAHIAGGDLKTLAAGRLLLALLWPQPLFWLLRRVVRMDQETLADAAGAEVAGRVDYAQQLVAWARGGEGGRRGRDPRLAGAVGLWEGPSQLKRRVAALLDDKLTVLRECSRRWRLCTAALAVVGAGALSLVTLQREEAAAQTTAAAIENDGKDGETPATTHGESGVARVVAVSETDGTIVGEEVDPAAVPNSFIVKCVDTAGVPLAGVKATIYRVAFRDGVREHAGDAESDASGEVRFADLAPADRLELYRTSRKPGEHNSALWEKAYLVTLRREGLATMMLINQEFPLAMRGYYAEAKLTAGQRLSGRVTSPDGKPVNNALVAAGGMASTFAIEGVNAMRTDAEGRYEFNDRPALDAKAAAERLNQNMFLSTAASDDVAAQARQPAVGEDLSASNLVVTHPDYAVTRVNGGDIPGEMDVTMVPAAEIAGRVVTVDGKGVPGMRVRAHSRPDIGVRPDGVIFRIAMDTPFSGNASTATTLIDAEGRYRIGNLPAGVYDVWAAPASEDPEQASLINRGISALSVLAGEPTAASDLVVGPGGTVRGQLVDVGTGHAPAFGANARATVAIEFVGGPQMQDRMPQQAKVNADGKFEFRVPPGKLRVILFVYDGEPENPNEPAYTTADDEYARGRVLEAAHGETIDARFEVWQYAKLQQQRAERAKPWQIAENDKAAGTVAFTEFLAKYPDHYDGLVGRARCEIERKQWAAAVADFERVLELHPDDVNARMMLANLLATSGDAPVRDGERAIELATQAAAKLRELEHTNTGALAATLSYLAAAYAETGDFEQAVATQREVIELTPQEQLEDAEARLRLYESGKPFHRQ